MNAAILIINGEKDNDRTCQHIQISTTGFWCRFRPYVDEEITVIEGCGNCQLTEEEKLGDWKKDQHMNFQEYCWLRLEQKKPLETFGPNTIYGDRLTYELKVVEELQFEQVFIICHNLVQWAKKQGIRVGVGRGSAAGSLICYLLGITGLDPIEYDLQFERFLIQGRVNPPDIDMDFQRGRRAEVYAHLETMLGSEHLARLCTFSFMRMRAAIRDVARVLEIPLETVDKILKSIPWEKKTLSEAINSQEIFRWVQQYPRLFEAALRLENKPRHVSIHAAGVIISGNPVLDTVPLQYNAGRELLSTAWDMYDCEEAGLIKLDILGLETLDVIQETVELVYKKTGSVIDIDHLTPNDPKVLKRFADGYTAGVFQLEEDYVKNILYEAQVDHFQDIVAINALLRPGALAANAPTEYAERKHGKKFKYIHETLKPILGPTYGLLVYQEQAIRIARDIAGFTIQEADGLRKAIAKTRPEVYARFRTQFVEGTMANGFDEYIAEDIWDMLSGAGSYMFNKSHSTCYAYIGYQTMWLKVYHPTEFWSALLNSKINDDEGIRRYIRELQENQFTILKPSAKESEIYFTPVRLGQIRAGFLRIKGVGKKAAQALVSLENRSSMASWIESVKKINRRPLNRKMLKILLDSDIFSCYNLPREEVSKLLDELSAPGQKQTNRLEELYLFDIPPQPTYKEIGIEEKQSLDLD